MKTRVIQDGPDATQPIGGPARAGSPPAVRGGRAVAGIAAAAVGVGALALGGVLVGVHETQRDAAGFYGSEGAALSTTTRAVVSPDLDVGTAGPDWLLRDGRAGTVRIVATDARDGPVFVGIGPRAEVAAYLDGVPHEVAEFDGSGGPPQVVAGAAAPAPPASQGFWARAAQGDGPQTVVWPIAKGDWSAVVMNADGSAGVRTTTRVALKTDLVLWLGGGALAVGVLLAGAGAALIASSRVRGRPARGAG